MRRVVAGHQKLTTTSWKQSLEADPLTTTQEAAEELNVDHSTVIRHLKQIGKVKKLGKWVPQELTKKKKNHHFEVLSSLNIHNNTPLLNQTVMWDKMWILYNNQWLFYIYIYIYFIYVLFILYIYLYMFYITTSSVTGLRSSSKALPKAKLAPKKGHSYCLVVCCLPDPLQLSES